MKAGIAFYKGPPANDWQHTVSHYAIRAWTWSRWSHAELVIDGWCYSSSTRDGGVRAKRIDLTTGRWDVVPVDLPEDQIAKAVSWFLMHDGDGYDWPGIGYFVLPLIPHDKDRWVCFESIGAALGMAGSHKLTADDLYQWAQARQPAGDHHD